MVRAPRVPLLRRSALGWMLYGLQPRFVRGGEICFQTDWGRFRCANLAGSLIFNSQVSPNFLILNLYFLIRSSFSSFSVLYNFSRKSEIEIFA